MLNLHKIGPFNNRVDLLVRQLNRWEMSIRDELARLWKRPKWNFREIAEYNGVGPITVQGNIGDWLEVDCTGYARRVVVPDASLANRGQQVMATRRAAVGVLSLRVYTTSGTLVGSTTSANGWLLCTSNGKEWREIH